MQNNEPIWFSEKKKTNVNADTYQTEKIEQVNSNVRTINIGDILDKPKHGFSVPIDYYLVNKWSDLVRDTFSKNSQLYKLGFIDKKSLKYVNKILKSKNKLSGHSILSYISINSWLQNNSWK